MTPHELALEEKKLKRGRTVTAFVIGLLVGVSVWAATRGKAFLTFALLVSAIVIGRRAAANMNRTREELKNGGHVD